MSNISSKSPYSQNSAFDKMIEGCQIIDFDYRYLYVNDAVAKQGNKTKEELLGHTMMEMYPGIETTKIFDYLRRCMKERTFHSIENEFNFPDGSKRYFQFRMEPVPEGVLIFSADITKAKEAEKQREEQFKRALELEKNEREFIFVASHQLMTPLALVMGYISMMLTGKFGNIDEQAKNYLELSLQGGTRMNKLIKTLLTTSRLENGSIKVKKTTFDMNALITEVIKSFHIQADDKKLTLEFLSDSALEVTTDKDHTREILSNLIGNAVKYTNSGQVAVTSKKEKHRAVVTITDTGIGINPQNLPHIFEKFYLSESWITKQNESNGLGLYITKLLLKLIDGNIKVESKEGKGSTFTFDVPLIEDHG